MSRAARIGWAALGLVLLAGGVAGVLVSRGWLPGVSRASAVLPDRVDTIWREWGFWAPTVAVIVGIIIAALGLLLLRAVLRPARGAAMSDVVLPEATRIASHPLARAFGADLRQARGVEDAAAYLTGTPDRPRLFVRLRVVSGTNLVDLRRYVDAALARFTATAGLRPELADVDVRIVAERTVRVH